MTGAGKIVEWRSACLAIMDAAICRVNIEMTALYRYHPAIETDATKWDRAHLQDRAADATIPPHHLVRQGTCFNQTLAHDPRGIRPKTLITGD
jgi:hypothetical protein